MALASSVLMFAASPQTFLGVASAQESLLLLIDVLPAYGRHFRRELGANAGQGLVVHRKAFY
jgi:hypothetical protein